MRLERNIPINFLAVSARFTTGVNQNEGGENKKRSRYQHAQKNLPSLSDREETIRFRALALVVREHLVEDTMRPHKLLHSSLVSL